MENKNVLVLMSTYNGEKYLSEQINSILNQKTSHTISLLVRDDGSTDGTKEILESYRKKYAESKKIECIYGQNIGYIKSFFELINKAGDYDYYFLSDQDDIWLEDKIDSALNMIGQQTADVPVLYACPSFLMYQNGINGTTQKKIREITLYNTIIQNILPGHNQAFNKALLNTLKNDVDCSKIFVHDSYITNVAQIKGKIFFDNTPHTLYRQHGSNELGYRQNIFLWIRDRLKRVRNNDSKKYAKQINYIYDKFKDSMNKEEQKEVYNFICSQKKVISRLAFVIKTKLYRQRKSETILFKMLYLFGGYK